MCMGNKNKQTNPLLTDQHDGVLCCCVSVFKVAKAGNLIHVCKPAFAS